MQSADSKVSIIVVNYNGMAHLDVCLSSVLAQTYTKYEVVFVDNNSTDGSLEHARTRFPSLIVVANAQNLGYAGGINSGFTRATGKYIAPLNTDTEVSPDWLGALVAFLDANDDVGAVTPKVLLFDDRTRVNTLGLNIHFTGLAFCRGLGTIDSGATNPQKVSGLSGCSYVIRRELFELMGGAPAEAFMTYDDVVVSWMLNLMGSDIYCVPGAVVYHKYHLKMNPEKFLGLEKNRDALLLSSWKPATLVVLSPAFLFVELLMVAYCLLRGREYVRSKFRSVVSLFRDTEYVRQRRARVREVRRVSDLQMLRRLKPNLDWRQLFNIV
jgi:GT2 family glycosyltransferase